MADEVLDLEVARLKMKQWREEPCRNSEEVVELGECLLEEHGNKLGDELWTVYEQVCVAALDCANMELATMCLDALRKQFPGSIRVEKLQAMKLETDGRWEHALDIYNKIITAEPSNAVVRKRIITILKGQGRSTEAIKELNEYLKSFMNDHEAWMELCDLYISKQQYSKASFCLEELIMSNPHNHLLHQKYAEVRYTIGGTENMELARKYFAQALKLDNNNMRALYGFFMAASNLASAPKAQSKTKKDNAKYSQWAAQQILLRYQEAKDEHEDQMTTLETMLDSLQITASANIPS